MEHCLNRDLRRTHNRVSMEVKASVQQGSYTSATLESADDVAVAGVQSVDHLRTHGPVERVRAGYNLLAGRLIRVVGFGHVERRRPGLAVRGQIAAGHIPGRVFFQDRSGEGHPEIAGFDREVEFSEIRRA